MYEEIAHEINIHIEHSISKQEARDLRRSVIYVIKSKASLVTEDQYTRAFRSFSSLFVRAVHPRFCSYIRAKVVLNPHLWGRYILNYCDYL